MRIKPNKNQLAAYLEEINRIPLLSREEEAAAARMAAAGDNAAKEKLVKAGLRFVIYMAKKYRGLGLGLGFEDLICEGNTGLVNAADRFDPGKGCRFITYVAHWIRHSILDALYDRSRMIRLPRNQAVELAKIEKAIKYVHYHYPGEDAAAEAARLLNVEQKRIEELTAISRETVSLEESGNAVPIQDGNENGIENDIENLLNILNTDEAAIIRCHYGIGGQPEMTFKEIGRKYHISKDKARRIEVKAIEKLKNYFRIKKRRQEGK